MKALSPLHFDAVADAAMARTRAPAVVYGARLRVTAGVFRAGRLEGKARTQEWWGLWRACPSVRMRLRRSVSVYVGVFVCF